MADILNLQREHDAFSVYVNTKVGHISDVKNHSAKYRSAPSPDTHSSPHPVKICEHNIGSQKSQISAYGENDTKVSTGCL